MGISIGEAMENPWKEYDIPSLSEAASHQIKG